MPKVSVVIPTYNRGKYIAATINTVLNQTYKDFEIIVIDDGSTDDTQRELEQFGGKIKIITQPNSERAVSRNNGVKNSTGAYIAFLDSDDLWSPDKLEKQVEVLDNLKDIVLVYGQSYRINNKGEQIKTAQRQMQGFSGNVFKKLSRCFALKALSVSNKRWVCMVLYFYKDIKQLFTSSKNENN